VRILRDGRNPRAIRLNHGELPVEQVSATGGISALSVVETNLGFQFVRRPAWRVTVCIR
jgi:hypothetical protein